MVFSATMRPMSGSRALNTTPMAPRPSSRRISYLPIFFVAFSLASYCQKIGVAMRFFNFSGLISHRALLPRRPFRFHNHGLH
jgi:hypothetical protein